MCQLAHSPPPGADRLVVFASRPLNHVRRARVIFPRFGVGSLRVESPLRNAHEALEQPARVALDCRCSSGHDVVLRAGEVVRFLDLTVGGVLP